jgi:glucose/mannose-6-phosphate isomerase
MNLDDTASFTELDSNKMISHIRGLPEQLETAWQLGEKFPEQNLDTFDQILICGVGSSFIAAELVRDYLQSVCSLPISVCRDFDIPLWARTKDTLLLISSFSGEEKELLSCFSKGLENHCQLITIGVGGSLIEKARANGIACLTFQYFGPSRTALGFEFVLPLAVFYKAGVINSPKEDILAAAALMKTIQPGIDVDSPVVQNTAKRMAGQFLNRWVTLFSSGFMQPVAERWKSQINENAKTWAQVEKISDTCHSTVGGIINPEAHLGQMMTLFLLSPNDNPGDKLRMEAARQIFLVEGFNTDFYRAKGTSLLENMWTTIQFGDFISYYLAIAYKVDPTPVPGIAEINSILD